MSGPKRIPNFEAMPIAIEIARLLKPACQQIAIAGSLRRNRVDIGDIELVAIPYLFAVGNALYWLTDRLLDEGSIQPTEKKAWGEKQRKFMFKGIQVDLYFATWQNYGYIYWLRTGPGDANKYIMQRFFKKTSPFKCEDGFVWYDNQPLWLDKEEKWFRLLGMPYLQASERTLERYRHLITARTHRYGNPEPMLARPIYLPTETVVNSVSELRQLTLFDTKPKQVPRIILMEQPAPSASTVWSLDDLFTVNNMVWVNCDNRWSLEPSDSQEVQSFIRSIQKNPAALHGLTEQLRQYLAVEPDWKGHEFSFGDEVEWDFKDDVLHKWQSRPKIEDVPVENILPGTQDSALKRHVRKYFNRYKTMGRAGFRNEQDQFPTALKFIDDEHYYITDGHHRYMTAILLNLPYLPCQVDYISKPINDCIWYWYEETEELA